MAPTGTGKWLQNVLKLIILDTAETIDGFSLCGFCALRLSVRRSYTDGLPCLPLVYLRFSALVSSLGAHVDLNRTRV